MRYGLALRFKRIKLIGKLHELYALEHQQRARASASIGTCVLRPIQAVRAHGVDVCGKRQAFGKQQVCQHAGHIVCLRGVDGLLQREQVALLGISQVFAQIVAQQQAAAILINGIDLKTHIGRGLASGGAFITHLLPRAAYALGGDVKNSRLGLAQCGLHKLVRFFLFFGIYRLGYLHQNKTALPAVFGI